MPFTPIHLGPGLAFKAIGGRSFSFMVFGGAQVLMDIEPLVGILRGWPVLHGYTHTVLGALAIGTVAGIIGRPISDLALRVADRAYILEQGRVTMHGTAKELLAHPDVARGYLGSKSTTAT